MKEFDLARFSYRAIDATGREDSGRIESQSRSSAYEELAARGLTVYDIANDARPISTKPWFLRDIALFEHRLTARELATLCELMAVLYHAQLPVLEVVRIVRASSENTHIRNHFARVEARVLDGGSLAREFGSAGNLFPPIMIAFLKLGEDTNNMGPVMVDLADYFRAQRETAAKVASAIIYPAILIVAAILLMLMVVFYLAPTLQPIFTSSNVAIPKTLATMLTLRNFLTDYWWLVSLSVVGVIVVGVSAGRVRSLRAARTRFIYHIPVLGPLKQAATLSRVSRSLQLLLRSGAHFSDALKQSADVLGPDPYADMLNEASKAVTEGGSASEVFGKMKSPPRVFLEMFRVGEETNRLPEILGSIVKALDLRVEQSSERLLQLLTPVLTVIIGGAMGALIYTVMGAILEVNDLAF